jgi:hypothetical protein
VKHFRVVGRAAVQACQLSARAASGERPRLTDDDKSAACGKPEEHTMKKRLFAALAVLGLVFGTVAFAAPANAYTNLFPPNNNQGANS